MKCSLVLSTGIQVWQSKFFRVVYVVGVVHVICVIESNNYIHLADVIVVINEVHEVDTAFIVSVVWFGSDIWYISCSWCSLSNQHSLYF